jgi:hypothetical protein
MDETQKNIENSILNIEKTYTNLDKYISESFELFKNIIDLEQTNETNTL